MAMYEYRATSLYVVDGDTLDLDVDLGLETHVQTRFRLYGINTSELHSKDPAERQRAVQAKDLVTRVVTGKLLVILTVKDRREKFGRYLAIVTVEGDSTSVNQQLLSTGLATAYTP